MVTDGYHSTFSPGCMLFITNYVCAVDFSAGFVYKPTHMHVANRFLPLEDVFFLSQLYQTPEAGSFGIIGSRFLEEDAKENTCNFLTSNLIMLS